MKQKTNSEYVTQKKAYSQATGKTKESDKFLTVLIREREREGIYK
jgi:hypothetical protein